MNAPVVGRVEFAPYVVGADALKREQARSASLLAALRLVLQEVDPACARGADALRLGALYATRKIVLDAITAAKE